MKVRNLLLAGLAVAAMTACSNDVDEIVDNGNQNPETALMQLSFEVPGTRATSVDIKDDQQGSLEEYDVQTVDVQLTYIDNSTKVFKKDIKEFTVENEGQTLILTNTEVVPAGKIKEASAVLNKGTLDPWSPNAFSVTETGLSYLTSGVAKEKNFLMSGKITEEIEFIEGSIKNVVIPVSRVSAKLDEVTTQKGFTYTIDSNADADAKIGEPITITLEDYTYGNLAKSSYIMPGVAVEKQTYFHSYGTAKTDYEYNKMDNTSVVYCLENAATTGLQNNSTYVLYRAKVKFDGVAPKVPFYVWNKTVYKTLDLLKADNFNLPKEFTDSTPQADFEKKQVYKYEDGECFYMTEVDYATDNHKIVRNTWYKLDVESIAKLGYPTPDVPPVFNNAYMNLKITINPWAVRFNKIHF